MALPNKTYTDYMEEMAFGPKQTASYEGAETQQTAGTPSAISTQEPAGTEAVTSQAATPTAQATTAAPTATAPTTQGGGLYSISLGGYAPDPSLETTYGSLFSPISEQIQGAGAGLQSAATSFLDEAGTTRNTWDTLGGAGILGDVVAGTRPDQEAIDLGKTAYKGPETLPQGALDDITGDVSDLLGWQDAMRGGGHVEELISQKAPGLTTGERRSESRAARSDPGFQTAEKATTDAIAALLKDIESAQGQATGIAEQKKADAADIAQQTQGWLTGEGGEYSTLWDKAVAEKEAENAAIEKLIQDYKANPTIENLEKIPGWARDWRVKDFNTGVNQTFAAGQEAWNSIWNDPTYLDIKDIPLMAPRITSHGYETIAWPDEVWAALKKKVGSKEALRLKALAKQRQAALEAAGFAGGEKDEAKYGSSAVIKDSRSPWAFAGEFSDVMPMYHADEWFTPEDISNYLGFESVDPSRENLSSAEERAAYNHIMSLLGMITGQPQDLVEDPSAAWSRPEVTGDWEAYQANQGEQYGDFRDALKDEQNKWYNARHKVRHDYRKAKSGGLRGFLGDVATGRLGGAWENLSGMDEMDWLTGFMGPDAISLEESRKRAQKRAEKQGEKAGKNIKPKMPK